MSHIVIGKAGRKDARLDLDALLRGRMLVQANPGKGKSWLLRRLAEELFGKVQVIIIDPEGEFATLREKFGYVLVGKGGETPADPRSAALVAERLLAVKACAVCDLYEMKPFARHEWVQKFLDAVIDSPKNLWHPCVIIVDEAHVFCPEKGAGESVASEAMIGLATRGRKRGFAAVFATQRLGKLRKDAAAELLTVLIGGTFIDIDRKRAADALGIYGKDQHEFFDAIKVLPRGQFYALGPAISDERLLVEVGPVRTTHPEAGSARHAAEPPPAPEEIARLLPKLADLPKQAEEKAKTEAELRAEIRSLKATLRAQPKADVKNIVHTDPRAIERAVRQAVTETQQLYAVREAVQKRLNHQAVGIARELWALAEKMAKAVGVEIPPMPKIVAKVSGGEIQTRSVLKPRENDSGAAHAVHPRPNHIPAAHIPQGTADSSGDLSRSQRAILRAIAEFEAIGRTQISKSWIAARAGASYTSSTFTNNLGYLRSNSYIIYPGPDQAALLDKGREAAGPIDPPATSQEMLDSCLRLLSSSQQAILKALYANHPNAVAKADLAEMVAASAASSTYGNNLGALKSAGMIEYPAPGTVKCADWLFLE